MTKNFAGFLINVNIAILLYLRNKNLWVKENKEGIPIELLGSWNPFNGKGHLKKRDV